MNEELHASSHRKRAREKTREHRGSLVAKMSVVACLRVLGHAPFLARCFNPNCSLGEGVKLVEVLCVRAQHAGTQIPTPFRSGAVQTAGKRHARECQAPGADPVRSRGSRLKHSRAWRLGQGVVGGQFTHTLLGKLGVW